MIPSRFLFRFQVPCFFSSTLWTAKGLVLDESYRLPSFAELENPSGAPPFELYAGWNQEGIAFSLRVFGKKQQPWCRAVHPEESDGLHLCLDTRNVHDVHRATRFCHRFALLPFGSGPNLSNPSAVWLPIHRAKGHPNPLSTKQFKLLSGTAGDGYRFDVMIPADQLTGFAPDEHPLLGFHYMFVDRELGNHAFLLGPPFPHDQDPSLWGTLELLR